MLFQCETYGGLRYRQLHRNSSGNDLESTLSMVPGRWGRLISASIGPWISQQPQSKHSGFAQQSHLYKSLQPSSQSAPRSSVVEILCPGSRGTLRAGYRALESPTCAGGMPGRRLTWVPQASRSLNLSRPLT